jgi:hypothetical protein
LLTRAGQSWLSAVKDQDAKEWKVRNESIYLEDERVGSMYIDNHPVKVNVRECA